MFILSQDSYRVLCLKFFCRVPLGPPKIKKRSKNGPDAHLRNIQQIQEYCDKVKSDMTRPRNRSFAFLKRTHYV
jgi:hypothetical protein